MKKTLALLMALVMLTGLLAGCGGDDALLGTWEASVEVPGMDELNQEFASAGLGDYIKLDSLSVAIRFTFNKDGTYSRTMDVDTLTASVEDMKNKMKDGLTAFAEDAFAAQGMEGMTVDDVFSAMGTSLDELMGEMSLDDEIKEVEEEIAAEGNYKTKDGKLYLSDGLDHIPDDEMYQTYTIEGDTMTILDSTGGDGSDAGMYPLELKKVG